MYPSTLYSQKMSCSQQNNVSYHPLTNKFINIERASLSYHFSQTHDSLFFESHIKVMRVFYKFKTEKQNVISKKEWQNVPVISGNQAA